MTDKTGRDATEFRTFTEDGRTFREPVVTDEHRREMAAELLLPGLHGPDLPPDRRWWAIDRLYFAGWSYRLIAQFLGMSNEDVREALMSGGRALSGVAGWDDDPMTRTARARKKANHRLHHKHPAHVQRASPDHPHGSPLLVLCPACRPRPKKWDRGRAGKAV